MKKTDTIVAWPRNADYPLWREFIHNERDRFHEVIVVFTETHQGHDYRQFVRDAMMEDRILFLDSPLPNGEDDWRNIAVNFGLLHAKESDWIFFTEQDFFPQDGFFQGVEVYQSMSEVITIKEGSRMHPACMFFNKKSLDKTSKNFGIVPGKRDHFGIIQDEIERLSFLVGIIAPKYYIHMAGLSHNFSLISRGENPVYKQDEFDLYVANCLRANVAQSPEFVAVVSKYLSRL